MSAPGINPDDGQPRMISIKMPRAVTTALLTLPLLALTGLIYLRAARPDSPAEYAAAGLLWAFFGASFALMVHTGKTDRWRLPALLVYAGLFAASYLFGQADLAAQPGGKADFMCREGLHLCHIAALYSVIPAAAKDLVTWPGIISGAYFSVLSVFLAWLGATLILGKGWCSWTCIFAAFDDFFSRLLPRAVIVRSPAWLKDLPLALLIFTLLVSAAVLFPVYCIATCPFKLVTEVPAWASTGEIIRVAIYTSVFIVMVVVLPLLMKRRAQCTFLCPVGALQSCAGRFTPFHIRVDRALCTGCGDCVKNCPSLAMTRESRAGGGAEAGCTLCGRCADGCPAGAIHYHVRGTPDNSDRALARALFLYPAFLILAYFTANICVGVTARLLSLAGGLV